MVTGAHEQVLAAVPRGARVLLVGVDPPLVRALEGSGCAVLAIESAPPWQPPSKLAVAFHPDVLVLAWPRGGAEEVAAALALVAPRADVEVVVAFRNAGAASAILASVAGAAAAPGVPRHAVEAALSAAGLGVEGWAAPAGAPQLPLAADAERALGALLQQLDPTTADDVVVLRARRGAPRRQELVDALASVVLVHDEGASPELLEQALFSLAGQRHRPLEVLLVARGADPALSAALDRHRRLEAHDARLVLAPAARAWGGLATAGVEAARGRYLCILERGSVAYPQHVERLVEALRRGEAAFAVAPTREAYFSIDATGALHCRAKRPRAGGSRREDLLRAGAGDAHDVLLDRARLGRFGVALDHESAGLGDDALVQRLAAIFEPAFVPGPPSCERRVLLAASAPVPLPPRRPASAAPGRTLAVLATAAELLRALDLASRRDGARRRLQRRVRELARRIVRRARGR
jgi:hypothetical protein